MTNLDDDAYEGVVASHPKQQPNSPSIRNTAMSWFAASAFAVSTAMMMPTVSMELPGLMTDQPQPTHITVMAGIPSAHAAETKTAGTSTTTTKAPRVKLPKEEKERLDAKKNLDLAQQTLKEYQKYVADVSSAFKKADALQQSTTKQSTNAKMAFVKASDKLSNAKSQKMPSSAIQELSKDAGALYRTTTTNGCWSK
jgi:hypothetical protein